MTKVSRFAGFIREKVSRFFPSPPSYIHDFPTLYERFNKKFTFLTWILLKTVIKILGNGRECITDMCVQISRFPGWPGSHRRRRATVEVSPRWNRLLTASLLASSASYFLISRQKPLDSLPLLRNISSNILKFFMVQLSVEQKFSRENFRSLLKICENHESFLTVKLLSFMVCVISYNTKLIYKSLVNILSQISAL